MQFEDRSDRKSRQGASRLDQRQWTEESAGLDDYRRTFGRRRQRGDVRKFFLVACQVVSPEFKCVLPNRLESTAVRVVMIVIDVTIPEPLVLMQDGTISSKRQDVPSSESLTLFPTLI